MSELKAPPSRVVRGGALAVVVVIGVLVLGLLGLAGWAVVDYLTLEPPSGNDDQSLAGLAVIAAIAAAVVAWLLAALAAWIGSSVRLWSRRVGLWILLAPPAAAVVAAPIIWFVQEIVF